MSDKTYVGFATERFNDSAKQTAITKVEVYNGSVSGSAGSGDADATLRVEFPMVQTTADAASIAATILSKVSGYKYQPYEADNSVVDPAAELGDGVSICGDYGGMYVQSQTLNNACRSDISAPKEEEVDNEYPFSTSENRYVERVAAETKATIQVLDGQITAEVTRATAAEGTLSSSINQTADRVAVVVDSDNNIKAAQIVASINGGASSIVIDADHIAVGDITIDGDQINAGTVTANEIAANTITASKIADSTITGAKIAGATITDAKIAASTITSSSIASQTIVAGNMATDSIINRCIQSGSIAKTTCNSEVQGLLADALYAAQVFAGTVVASNFAASNCAATTLKANTRLFYQGKLVTLKSASASGYTFLAVPN